MPWGEVGWGWEGCDQRPKPERTYIYNEETILTIESKRPKKVDVVAAQPPPKTRRSRHWAEAIVRMGGSRV